MGLQAEIRERVQIRLLGGVQVATSGGDRVDVGPAKCQAVLAALALSVGEAVPVSRLVDVVWGEQPPATAEKTLQGYAARLRKGLGPKAIVRVGTAYRLVVDPDAVDVTRFRRHVAAGNIDAALAEWRGVPLAGLDVPGLRPAADGLVEQWLGVVETDLARRVDTDPSATIAPLTQLTRDHPFREGLWALLMTALYRAERQGDALAAFQRARRHLVDELGVEPGQQLRDLEALILDHDNGLRGDPTGVASTRGRPTGTVTFGFCEVEDAARLWAEHRRKMAAAMARLDALVRQVAGRHSATVLTVGGETFGLAFHRADDAAAWALELQVAVDREPWPGGVEVRLRAGLHTGETEEQGNGYFGAAVHTAARLAAAGHGGQTLVSGVTAVLLERDDLRDLGSHRLEGIVGDHHVLQLGEGEHPPLRIASGRRGNLPRRLDRLVGRDYDIDVVTQTLDAAPVVTLVGPGGVGKTALALAAARRCEADSLQRVWLAELDQIDASADVPRAVADTLGVVEGAGRTLADSIVAVLRSHPTLLVLDNCEHVLDGAAELGRAVAQHCASARILATSREGLGIAGEQLIAVSPLDSAAAVELFAERAQAASEAFDLDTSRASVEDVCRRLDGLPLAIELAAARTRSLTPTQLLARLDDRLRLLTGGRRTGAPRHRTLRATVQWSYDLLSRPQQTLLQRLSVFPGPFDISAAEAVAADSAMDAVDVDQLLGDLVERSMVTVEPGPFGRRFRLLETLRHFAAEQLAEHGNPNLIAHRHACWCRAQVTRLHGMLAGPGEVEAVARLGGLWASLRAAVDWGCTTGDLGLAEALVRPVVTELIPRRRAEIGDWAERILALIPAEDEARVVFWLAWAADRRMRAGDHDAYEALIERHGHADHPLIRYTRASLYADGEGLCAASPAAVAWLRERGDDHAAAFTELLGLASGLLTLGRFDELEALASAMVRRHQAEGPPTLLYWALGMLGYSAQLKGQSEQAGHSFAKAAAIHVPAGTTLFHRAAEARAVFEQGERSRGTQLLRDHVEGLLDSDYTDAARLVAIEYINLMTALDRLGDAARALAYLDTTGDFGALARQTVIADAATKIAAHPEISAYHDEEPDGRQALTDMYIALEQLAGDLQPDP